MNKKTWIILGVSLSIFCLYKIGRAFGPGSYPFSEHYELNYAEQEVINAAEIVKEKNSYSSGEFGREVQDTTDYLHHIYFKIENKTFLTWATFALVSIKDADYQWERINDDLGFFENRRIKQLFEDEILKKIETQLRLQKN